MIRRFETDSGIPIPEHLGSGEQAGQFPYTRGIHASMYRGKVWTMRQFAGFGSPEETNRRFKYLLSQGMTGLSTAFDMPALMGYDSDHPMSQGEVGREGVSINTLDDFERLFEGIPLEKVSVSMTINATAIVALAMYLAVAEKRGIPASALSGTLQNDILKEYVAQKEWIVGPRPAMRLVTDTLEFGAQQMPRWNMISISGYHIREAGANAVQELAFTLADGIAYVEACLERGMAIDDFAPRLSFFWDVHNDLFEEVAKFRAGRRIWARLMRERFEAKDPRSWMLRAHAQTAGVSLMAQQPYNNVVRVALQALAAVLGGTQSLHTNALDETYALPTESSATLALRTQQILASETGVDRVVDPLGGSHYVESLTDAMETRANEYLRKIEKFGGTLAAIEQGFQQAEIAETAFAYQRSIERNEREIIGVNRYKDVDEKPDIPLLKVDERVTRDQLARLQAVKRERSAQEVEAALGCIERAARGSENLVPWVLRAVKVHATLGEISDVFRKVWGRYREAARF